MDFSDDELIDNYYFTDLINYTVGARTLGELNMPLNIQMPMT
jgi:hypothetical protein